MNEMNGKIGDEYIIVVGLGVIQIYAKERYHLAISHDSVPIEKGTLILESKVIAVAGDE